MPADMQQIMDAAGKLGQLVAQHPAVDKYKQAQKAVGDDADASRLMRDFDQALQRLAQQEQGGVPVSDAQRRQLEGLQSKIFSHIKIKALNMAQVEFMDLLRKVTQTVQRPVMTAVQGPPASAATPAPASRLTAPPA